MPNTASLNFDGVNDYADRPSSDSILNFTGDWTIEAWAKLTAYGGAQALVAKGEPLGAREAVVFWLGTFFNGFQVAYENNFTEYSLRLADATPYTNLWTHWTGTYDSTNRVLRLYINGSLTSTSASFAAGPQATAYPVAVGASRNSTNGGLNEYVSGRIDEVRLWNVRRSDAQISSYYTVQASGSESGLVACWRMNEGTGTTIFDKTANALDLTISGATWDTTDYPTLTDPTGQFLHHRTNVLLRM